MVDSVSPRPEFIRVNQSQWVRLSSINMIEKVEHKYHLSLVNTPGKMVVDPQYTRMEEILPSLTFQTSTEQVRIPETPALIQHQAPPEVRSPIQKQENFFEFQPPGYTPEPKQSAWIGAIAAQPNRQGPSSLLGSLI